TILDVYRGAKFDKEEFEKLRENQGKLISVNGYFSTSRRKSLAVYFAKKSTKRTDVIPVLFHIQCDIKHINENIIFADISEFSVYAQEAEVLFDLNACFLIDSIEKQESLHIIEMTLSNEGHKITDDYLELTQKETEELSVSIVVGRLLCNLEDCGWIEFNIGRALSFKCEWNQAREYYNRAYDLMMKNKPTRVKDSAWILNNIGAILRDQKNSYSQQHW
ncbi:unnamed protein product, partial [Rotaria magnacalcarata]